jgi:putative radical SAM enzyme (TIGR03279 family)
LQSRIFNDIIHKLKWFLRRSSVLKEIIKSIEPGSPADNRRISPGDRLVSVNGHQINDVLDYKFHTYDEKLLLELEKPGGRRKKVHLRKPEGMDIGLNFDTYLMDTARSCANKCLFCFVDQLPEGMRSTLYFKDDDARLSFLQGNYITLTNLLPREVQRIIDLHVSPINVSVHATDPQLRSLLLGNKNGGAGLEIMNRFSQAGIIMNCQIVCCPGLNDGRQLEKTMQDLTALYPQVPSVSIVPVGLTKHRQGLYALTPFDRQHALETVKQVEEFGRQCLEKYSSRIFFCADELYLKAGLPLPEDEFYEDYPQLENGVGLMRLLITEFESAVKYEEKGEFTDFSVATGVSAAPFIDMLVKKAQQHLPQICARVYPIENDFFGHTINVAGLVTGGDIIKQLSGKELGKRLLIPRNMLRQGEGVFLDDVTVPELSERLGVPVRIVEQDGGDLADAVFGN